MQTLANRILKEHVKWAEFKSPQIETIETKLEAYKYSFKQRDKLKMTSLLQETLYETHAQAPPPSKDFHHLTITKNEVVWRSWGISFRHSQEQIFPREVKKLHNDFLLDDQLHKRMKNIFGNKMLDYVLSLCQGHYDFLVRMPENVIIHILSFLNADDIEQLAKTCKKFQKIFKNATYLLQPEHCFNSRLIYSNTNRKLCNTEDFWEKIKRVQDKYTLDAGFPDYKNPTKVIQRRDYLTQMQRRQTTFF